MDAKVAYWTAAFINLGVLTAFAAVGALRARRGEVARHRRAVTIAAALVVGFLISYPFKLWFLGRENLELWGTSWCNVSTTAEANSSPRGPDLVRQQLGLVGSRPRIIPYSSGRTGRHRPGLEATPPGPWFAPKYWKSVGGPNIGFGTCP